jgi:hypothetical protein
MAKIGKNMRLRRGGGEVFGNYGLQIANFGGA